MNMFVKNFIDNKLVKDITMSQYLLGDQVKKILKMSETMTQKTAESFSENFNVIMSNQEKVEELSKIAEENQKKMQMIFGDLFKSNFDQKIVEEQVKQFENNINFSYKSTIEQIEKNSQFVVDNIIGKMFENSMVMFQNMNESFLKYNQEQFNFFVGIQKELMNGIKDTKSIQEMPNKIVKISQEIIEHNTKTVSDNVKNVVEVGSKVVNDGIKTAIEVGASSNKNLIPTKKLKKEINI